MMPEAYPHLAPFCPRPSQLSSGIRTDNFASDGTVEKPRNCHCEESGWVREGKGNDDEAICASVSGDRKSRLPRRPATAGLLAMTRSGLFLISETSVCPYRIVNRA